MHLAFHVSSMYRQLNSQERVNKGKASLFDRMVTQLNSAATSTTSGPYTSSSAQAAAAIMRLGGLASNSERSQDKPAEEPLREEDGVLNVEVAETMLKWHAEAIGRCTELCPANDVYVQV